MKRGEFAVGEVARKKCSGCLLTKPVSDYSIRMSGERKGKPRSRCKQCESKATRVYYQRDVEASRERNRRQYQKKDRSLVLINAARGRAKKHGMEFNLDRNEIARRLALGRCEATDIPFEYTHPEGCRRPPWMPSIDRIDSSRGYTSDNIQIVVWVYNAAKCDYSPEVVSKMAKAIVEADQRKKKKPAQKGRPKVFDVNVVKPPRRR